MHGAPQAEQRNRRAAKERADDGAADFVPSNVFTAGFEKDSREEVSSNPLFARADGSAVVTSSQAIDAIRSMAAPPEPGVWSVIREQFVAQDDLVAGLTASNADLKTQLVRAQATIDALGGGPAAGPAWPALGEPPGRGGRGCALWRGHRGRGHRGLPAVASLCRTGPLCLTWRPLRRSPPN